MKKKRVFGYNGYQKIINLSTVSTRKGRGGEGRGKRERG